MQVQQYSDLFESSETKERGQWWHFKSNVIEPENQLYVKISDIIRESDLDEDSAYRFTVEALGAIDDMISNFDEDDRKSEGTLLADYLAEPEIVEQFSEAPIYNSEIMEWIAKSSNYSYLEDQLSDYGWDSKWFITDIARRGYSQAWEEHYYKVLEVVKG